MRVGVEWQRVQGVAGVVTEAWGNDDMDLEGRTVVTNVREG